MAQTKAKDLRIARMLVENAFRHALPHLQINGTGTSIFTLFKDLDIEGIMSVC